MLPAGRPHSTGWTPASWGWAPAAWDGHLPAMRRQLQVACCLFWNQQPEQPIQQPTGLVQNLLHGSEHLQSFDKAPTDHLQDLGQVEADHQGLVLALGKRSADVQQLFGDLDHALKAHCTWYSANDNTKQSMTGHPKVTIGKMSSCMLAPWLVPLLSYTTANGGLQTAL